MMRTDFLKASIHVLSSKYSSTSIRTVTETLSFCLNTTMYLGKKINNKGNQDVIEGLLSAFNQEVIGKFTAQKFHGHLWSIFSLYNKT